MKNHRIVVTRHGGPDVLQLIEEACPEPGPGEMRVKVLASMLAIALGKLFHSQQQTVMA